jgi:hypothetical protein
LNISQIARRTGRTRETIGNVLRDPITKQLQEQMRAEKRERARQTLAASVDSAADAWRDTVAIAAKKGDHRPAKDLLLYEGVINPPNGGAGQVVVYIGNIGPADVQIGGPAES